MRDGSFIVLEGIDGAGKATQLRLLEERLKAMGHQVEVFDFPQYAQESSYFIRRYLGGGYGPASKVNPYTTAIFYALDRFEAAPAIRKALESGKIVLSNRYAGANMAHQGAKFSDQIEQRSFFVWEDSLEFQLLSIPRPTFSIVLNIPSKMAHKLIESRASSQKTKLDEHEKDADHLTKAADTYRLLCDLFPQDFRGVECTEDDRLLSITDINNRIWNLIRPSLPDKPIGAAHSITMKLNEITSQDNNHPPVKSKTKPDKLYESLSLDPQLLSLGIIEELESVLKRPLPHKKIWARSEYNYYIPRDLPQKTLAKYEASMRRLADLHKQMSLRLDKNPAKEELLRAALPMGALIDVPLEMSMSEAQKCIAALTQTDSEEFWRLAKRINTEGRKLRPEAFEATIIRIKDREPESLNNIITRLASEHLPQTLAPETEAIRLVEVLPRNEFKILTDSIYPYSNLPRNEIEAELEKWTYQQKYEALVSALAKSGGAAEPVQYRFDIVADRVLLDKILASGLADEVKIQPSTPRYGYEVSVTIDRAGIVDEFMDCFDTSLELFSSLQAANREDLAGYAILLGHKTRFQLSFSLTSLKKQLASPQDKDFKQLLNQITERITEVHPIIGSILTTPARPKQPNVEQSKTTPRTTPKKRRGGRRHRSNRKTNR